MKRYILTYILMFLFSGVAFAQFPNGLKDAADKASGAVKEHKDKAKKAADDAKAKADEAKAKADDAKAKAADAKAKAADMRQQAADAVSMGQDAQDDMFSAAPGQMQRIVSLYHEQPFTDSLTLSSKDNAIDMAITFTFNQEAGELKVTLESRRLLHVFRRDAVYKEVVMGDWFRPRRLNRFKLPYEADAPADAIFKISSNMKHKMAPRRARRDHVFKQWDQVSGMRALPAKFSMINDKIEQVYKIDDDITNVTFALGEVMTLTHNPHKPKKYNYYIIDNLKDFNKQYMIAVIRDMCLGKEQEIADAKAKKQELDSELKKLSAMYPNRTAKSVEMFDMFQTTRNALLKKYSYKEINSPCDDLQAEWEAYNASVDSLKEFTCRLSDEIYERAVGAEMVTGLDGGRSKTIDASGLLFKARQLDQLVALWKVSTNAKERNYIKMQCEKLIDDADMQSEGKLAVTKIQKDAVEIMRKAVEYFNKTCK